jgi:hypothetical protein
VTGRRPTPLSSEDAQTFEHERWLAEKELREREIELKTREQDRLDKELTHKISKGHGWGSWFAQPLVLAVFAAAVAAAANVWVSWSNNESQRQIESMKAEASRILTATKSGTGIDGTLFALSPSPSLRILATSDIQ